VFWLLLRALLMPRRAGALVYISIEDGGPGLLRTPNDDELVERWLGLVAADLDGP
jgi:hypothetical protein